ncbi:TetR/AcrR family transcriptional regulator [Streptomyces tendae]|uniref:TetR/AcrR family transcriptional regulator n=1 Tax=Streptomyces tendae TaxID=1932 RepID=UPI0036571B88
MSEREGARRGRPPTMDRSTVIAAARRVLRDEGPGALTVRRVAEELGVSRQIVYTQFGSLGGLVDVLYQEGFGLLRDAGNAFAPALRGADLVIAWAVAYRRHALEHPELYGVMFERPFRDYTPSDESRAAALAAFDPLVRAVASTGRPAEQAGDLAFTLWGTTHGLVHLELQGYLPSEPTGETRVVTTVTALLA